MRKDRWETSEEAMMDGSGEGVGVGARRRRKDRLTEEAVEINQECWGKDGGGGLKQG